MVTEYRSSIVRDSSCRVTLLGVALYRSGVKIDTIVTKERMLNGIEKKNQKQWSTESKEIVDPK